MKALFLLFCLVILHGCSCGCGSGHRNGYLRIGIDPDWIPINFGSQQAYVNGFAEDLLLEIARYSGIEFERVPANWDSLLDGIKEKKYDAVLTSLPPYPFNLAKYDFSQNFLELGPVLIVPADGQNTDLHQMKGELVGLVTGDPAALILQKYPDVVMRNYPSIPDLLNAVAGGEIEGALLNRIPAVNYVSDLYAGRLKIASAPMNDAGLRLVAMRGKQELLLRAFDKSIDHFKKKKKFQTLLKKWGLDS